MSSLGATATEFRKTLAAHRHRNSKMMSLQSTKTSEISSFVKNCNLAELSHLKKELNMWHKDTNFNLRKLDRKRENMYKSLLQLSTTKKKIKNVRQGKKKDNEDEQNWITSKRRPERRRNIFVKQKGLTLHELSKIDETNEPNILRLENRDDEVITALLRAQNEEKIEKDDDFVPAPSNFAPISNDYDQHRTHDEDNQKVKLNSNQINFEKESSENKNKDLKYNHNKSEEKRLSKGSNKRNSSFVTFDFSRSLGQKLSEEPEVIHEENVNHHDHDSQTSRSESHESQLVSVSQNLVNEEYAEHFDDKQLLSMEVDSDSDIIDRYVAEQQRLSEAGLFDNIDDNYFLGDYDQEEQHHKQNKRWKRKKKINPSHQLNTISAIQTRPGQKYDVAVYSKNSEGNLEKEMISLDTTVNVYKYFNIASHRERLQRKQLLLAAQNNEVQQRHRVNRFLEKLDKDLEQKRKAEQLRRKQAEDENEALQRRIEARKKGPPKYGMTDLLRGVPNYVRSYVPESRNSRNRRIQYRKKSSWAVPSLYTLQLPTRANSIFPNGNRAIPIIPEASSSHLVNINIDKYVIESSNVLGQ